MRKGGEGLRSGRAAFARQAWAEAMELLQAEDHVHPLEPEDLMRLATAAYLTGSGATAAIWARAHQDFLSQGNIPGAVRCAFWLGFQALLQGERAPAAGWLSRGSRLLDEHGLDVVERGYLLHATALRAAIEGDAASASATFAEAATIGTRFGDQDLVALARHGVGRTLIRLGHPAEGVAMLDEAMAAVTSGAVSPLLVGGVYCSVIEGCHEIYDLRRAREWTTALDAWCATQPERIPARGNCQIHRSRILQFHGAWSDALEEAQRAHAWLSQPPPHVAIGGACYQMGEVHRLRGEFDAAESAYREASRWGRDPEPGLAELRLMQGQAGRAKVAICRALEDAKVQRARAGLLPAAVEILLEAGEPEKARAAAKELEELADLFEVPYMHAMSRQANGALRLAEGKAEEALRSLRMAVETWQAMDAPYETARARVLAALAYRALGDDDAAAMELDAAQLGFSQLEARPDLARLERLAAGGGTDKGGRPDPAGKGGADAPRPGRYQPGDRPGAGHQRKDRRAPCQQHLPEARPVQPLGGNGVGLSAPAHLAVRPT